MYFTIFQLELIHGGTVLVWITWEKPHMHLITLKIIIIFVTLNIFLYKYFILFLAEKNDDCLGFVVIVVRKCS